MERYFVNKIRKNFKFEYKFNEQRIMELIKTAIIIISTILTWWNSCNEMFYSNSGPALIDFKKERIPENLCDEYLFCDNIDSLRVLYTKMRYANDTIYFSTLFEENYFGDYKGDIKTFNDTLLFKVIDNSQIISGTPSYYIFHFTIWNPDRKKFIFVY